MKVMLVVLNVSFTNSRWVFVLFLPLFLYSCSHTEQEPTRDIPVPKLQTNIPDSKISRNTNSSKKSQEKQEPVAPQKSNKKFSEQTTTHLKSVAREMIQALVENEYQRVHATFDQTLKNRLPLSKLEKGWKQLLQRVGHFQKISNVETHKKSNLLHVSLYTEFLNNSVRIEVIFNEKRNVHGLFLYPDQNQKNKKIASYVDHDKFREYQPEIGHKKWKLPATISIPNREKPRPGIILVHGAGIHDRNERIGHALPFEDIAWGLASRGFAVLRYDKRSFVYTDKLLHQTSSFTPEETTITDARKAVDVLTQYRAVNSNQIYLLGHGIGGTLLARIARDIPEIQGLIFLGAPSKSLPEIILHQYQQTFSGDGKLTKQEQQMMTSLKEKTDLVKNDKLTPDTPKQNLPFGLPASWWLYLQNYRPIQETKQLSKAMFFLQGARDQQIDEQHFSRWKNTFSRRTNVRFKKYPSLNHLFINQSSSDQKHHVSRQVILDLVDWINSTAKNQSDE